MSASLVGSEMCIKRQPFTWRRTAKAGHKKSPDGVGRHRSVARVCEVSVSYTHLTLPTICSV
eukprot:8468874-Alexandrium_andersonii.AAC.1